MTKFYEKDWYSPGEIVFNKYQLEHFILPNFDYFKEGDWPTCPSSYVGGHSSNINHSAYFETPKLVYVVVKSRLDMCPDGEMLLDRYQHGIEIGNMVGLYHWRGDEIELEQYIKEQLGYISGFRDKKITFRLWLQKRKGIQ